VTTTTPTQTTPTEKTSLRVYFLSHGKVQPVAREVPKTQAVASAAFTALLDGPSSPEAAIGLTTSMPRIEPFELKLVNGVLTLTTRPLSGAGLAQTVYTLTQFPGRDDVVVNGKRYARTDFEDFTPAILVEHPLPFTIVSSPLRMAGTANTFEATFDYELKDASGTVLKKSFVTASSGSGVRGTFDVTVPFTVSSAGDGTLTVYESSAKDGSRINVVDIPVHLEP